MQVPMIAGASYMAAIFPFAYPRMVHKLQESIHYL
jgi:hypothetical protein